MRKVPRTLLALAILGLLVGCRATTPRVPSRAVPIADVVPPGTASFALDPIPTPARAILADHVLPAPAGPVTYEDRPGVGPESYVLDVYEDGGRTVVRIAAGDARGQSHAAATLEQLTVRVDGRIYLRAGHVEDAPALPLRGSKRPRAWERLYKANFAYEKREAEPGRDFRIPREFVAVYSPGGTLDATEAGIGAAMAFLRAEWAKGVRRFSIEFDDVGFGMTPDTEDRFGAYAPALVHYLREIRVRLRRLDPDAVLYWLPQTYWTTDPRLRAFAEDLRLAGGLPPDLGLVVTGPDVISARIAVADVAGAQRAFGLTARSALVYDNLGREGDHGPLSGREAALMTRVDGVFGERGEILFRITRLDWNWNPLAYDPVRSHLLACREVAGAAAAPALSRLIREGDRLTADERARLVREVRASLAPPPGRARRSVVERILTSFDPGP